MMNHIDIAFHDHGNEDGHDMSCNLSEGNDKY